MKYSRALRDVILTDCRVTYITADGCIAVDTQNSSCSSKEEKSLYRSVEVSGPVCEYVRLAVTAFVWFGTASG